VRDGCKGAFSAPFAHSQKAHGHRDHDALFARAEALGVPLAIHPTFEPFWAAPVRFKKIGRAREFFYNVMLRQGVQQAFLSFFALGTLDRFPALRLGVLEAGSGWMGAFLDRMDAVHDTISASGVALAMKPSDYFRRQCFISGDPDETAAPLTIEHVGPECFLWATDYPHPDHPGRGCRTRASRDFRGDARCARTQRRSHLPLVEERRCEPRPTQLREPAASEDWDALAARAAGRRARCGDHETKSWNLHLFARIPSGKILGSDVIFLEPPLGG
jgi:hypothetical protein